LLTSFANDRGKFRNTAIKADNPTFSNRIASKEMVGPTASR